MRLFTLLALVLPLTSAVRVAKEKSKRVDVNYVTEMLDKLKSFVMQQTSLSMTHFDNEINFLKQTIEAVPKEGNNVELLQETLKQTEYEKVEAQAASLEAMEYYHTVRAAMGSTGGAPSCDFLSCGEHAQCRVKDNGRAYCECVSCYAGDGFNCRPSRCTPDFIYKTQYILPQAMVGENTNLFFPSKEISLGVIGEDKVIVAVRLASKDQLGSVVVGKVGGPDIAWGNWQAFSGDKPAHAPVVVGLPNQRFLVSFRDADAHAIGYIVGGELDMQGTGLQVKLGVTHGFVKEQEQKMALVTLPNSRVVCLYADHVFDEAGVPQQSSGGAALIQVLPDGVLAVVGKYHFAEGEPIQFLTAAKISPTSFVVGYRSAPLEEGQNTLSKELAAVFMETDGDILVIDTHPIYLEQNRPEVMERDLALVSKDLLAYSYYSSSQKQTKVALISVDPQARRLSAKGNRTKVISVGQTRFVHSISLPSGPSVPSTLTMVQGSRKNSTAEICGVNSNKELTTCKTMEWADSELKDVKGVRLPDGRLVMAFTTSKGATSYRMFSAEEAGAGEVISVV